MYGWYLWEHLFKFKSLLALGVIASLLSGCGVATSYKPRSTQFDQKTYDPDANKEEGKSSPLPKTTGARTEEGYKYSVDGDNFRTRIASEDLTGEQVSQERKEANIQFASTIESVRITRFNADKLESIKGSSAVKIVLVTGEQNTETTFVANLSPDGKHFSIPTTVSKVNSQMELFGTLQDIPNTNKSFIALTVNLMDESGELKAQAKINLRSYLASVQVRRTGKAGVNATIDHAVEALKSAEVKVQNMVVALGKAKFLYEIYDARTKEVQLRFSGDSLKTDDFVKYNVDLVEFTHMIPAKEVALFGADDQGLRTFEMKIVDGDHSEEVLAEFQELNTNQNYLDLDNEVIGIPSKSNLPPSTNAEAEDQLAGAPSEKEAQDLNLISQNPEADEDIEDNNNTQDRTEAEIAAPPEVIDVESGWFHQENQNQDPTPAKADDDSEVFDEDLEQEPQAKEEEEEEEEEEEKNNPSSMGQWFEEKYDKAKDIVKEYLPKKKEKLEEDEETKDSNDDAEAASEPEEQSSNLAPTKSLRPRLRPSLEEGEKKSIWQRAMDWWNDDSEVEEVKEVEGVEEAEKISPLTPEKSLRPRVRPKDLAKKHEAKVNGEIAARPEKVDDIVERYQLEQQQREAAPVKYEGIVYGLGPKSFLRVNMNKNTLPRSTKGMHDLEYNYGYENTRATIKKIRRYRDLNRFYSRAYPVRDLIRQVFEYFDVTPTLAYRIIYESNFFDFSPNETHFPLEPTQGNATAFGPFQLVYGTARSLGMYAVKNGKGLAPRDANDERYYFVPSLCAAAKHFSRSLDMFGDASMAILAYHLGDGGAKNATVRAFGHFKKYKFTYQDVRRQGKVKNHAKIVVDYTIASHFIFQSPDRMGLKYPKSVYQSIPSNHAHKFFPSRRMNDGHCEKAAAGWRQRF